MKGRDQVDENPRTQQHNLNPNRVLHSCFDVLGRFRCVYRLNCVLIYMCQLCLTICQTVHYISYIIVTALVVEGLLVTLLLVYDNNV
jgi:hypothetical protein